MNNSCAPHGWNAIASSSMDSQIAGVLAGFIFTGILLLLGQGGLKNRQTLGLFCPAFIALAFDSHMFSVVSGKTSDPYCVRVWSGEMGAAGMLAVGAMAIVTGLSWLLASHFETATEPGAQKSHTLPKGINLDRLVTLMAYGVGVTVTLFLASTTYDYVAISFPQKQPRTLTWMVLLSPVFVFAACGGIAKISTWRARRKDAPRAMSTKSLTVAAYGLGAYAVASPVFNGIIGELGTGWWKPTSSLVVYSSIGMGLFAPALLLIALVLAVAPLSTESVKPDVATPDSSRKASHPDWASALVVIRRYILSFRKLATRSTAPNDDVK